MIRNEDEGKPQEREDRTAELGAIKRLSEAADRTEDPQTGAAAQVRALKLITPNTPPELLQHLGMDKARRAIEGKDKKDS